MALNDELYAVREAQEGLDSSLDLCLDHQDRVHNHLLALEALVDDELAAQDGDLPAGERQVGGARRFVASPAHPSERRLTCPPSPPSPPLRPSLSPVHGCSLPSQEGYRVAEEVDEELNEAARELASAIDRLNRRQAEVAAGAGAGALHGGPATVGQLVSVVDVHLTAMQQVERRTDDLEVQLRQLQEEQQAMMVAMDGDAALAYSGVGY